MNFSKFSSLLLVSSYFFCSVLCGRNDYGCNGFDNLYGYFYPVDICYPYTTSWGGEASYMYECANSVLTKYEYGSRDCSGNVTDTDVYSSSIYDKYVTCESDYDGDTCNYVMFYEYDGGSDCDATGDEYSLYLIYVTEQCTNGSLFWGSSQYVTCSQDSYNIKYYSSDDCSGDVNYQYTLSPYHYADDENDYKMYCSETGAWSGCNEDGAFTMNGKYIVALFASIFGLLFSHF